MKKGIIVTSFGTTYEETRIKCIESIENRIKSEFPDAVVKRAFTSRMVINKLKMRDNYHVDTPTESLVRMKEEGIKDIYIQPLLIIEGLEYEKILREARDFLKENQDCNISIGKPLLSSDLDYERVVDGLNLVDKDEAIVFMGHGSSHETDISYDKLENTTNENGYKNVFFGTVEGEKTIEEVVEKLIGKNIKKILLKPFMLVAGDHAINDMASDEDDSWKSILKKNGISVTAEVIGLGENERIQDVFIDHLKEIYY
ncbi:sirohydrochlorin cobaltochelatase [Tissierella sp. Yu-01]|uniref:sirohydrochlorin cobaltochelatase n=1 Tax=Tissierella sp. Yu-01 TaxID=3035694 RepID=UPI00240E5737|nr:sirohydrochlorin cobaltochelatase [Tissierella sp. Yu-01]WFA10260.1 sirohydrochlorin cobaltochelatase [Tissierella sp. Yu-01]